MKINVIIPVNNRRENILKTLKCIDRQQVKPGNSFRTIVVCDNCTDGTREAIINSQYKNKVTVLTTPPRNTWNASIPRNMGAKSSDVDADYLYFLDSDVLLPPDRLQRVCDVYAEDQDPNRVLIGSYHFMRHTLEVKEPEWYLEKIDDYSGDIRSQSFEEHPYQKKSLGVGFALACFGGNLVVPRKLFFKTGGYDENCVAGVEDGDFGLVLWESGAIFSLDKGLHGWHNPHPITPERTKNLPEMVKYIDAKHNMDIVKESGKVYRQWGIDWKPPQEWLEGSGYTLEEFEEELKHEV